MVIIVIMKILMELITKVKTTNQKAIIVCSEDHQVCIFDIESASLIQSVYFIFFLIITHLLILINN